jgi:hypothetical protein
MAAGFSSRCRACNSAHRGEVDKRLLAGKSARSVSSWLQETHGERIPFQALAKHKAGHLDVIAEVKARSVAAAEPAFEAAVAETVTRVDALERGISRAERLADFLTEKLVGIDPEKPDAYLPRFPLSLSTVLVAAMREARECAVAKHELLHGKKVTADVAVDGLSGLLQHAFGDEEEGDGEEAPRPVPG